MEDNCNLGDYMYRRRNTIVSSEEETENCTGKRLINLYKRDYNSDLDLVESGKYLDSTSEGDAPIYPMDREDPEPEDEPSGGCEKSLSECRYNALLYVIGGYIVGLLLVLMWYYRNPKEACKDLNGKWIFIVLVTLLIIILVRRRPARCIAVLCLSRLSSSQFRTLVIALAFLVAFSGPIKNIIHNICILANTLTCGQNVLIQALKLMQRIINDPSHSVEEAFKTTLTQVCRLMNKLDKLLLNLERPISQIHATYKTCTDWLLLQKDHYEYKMGTPYNRCMKAGNLSIAQCKIEFGGKKKECCNLELFYWFCESLKSFTSFFDDNLQWSLMVIKEIFQRLRLCSMKIRYIFISSISFDHSLKFNSTGQFTPNKDHITEQDVNEKLEAQRHKLYLLLFLIDLVIFILLLTIIHQSLSFWLRYLSNEQYENVYITEAFENYDDKYYQTMGVRALPLSNFEENKYVKINSMRLLPKEYDTIYRSVTFLGITGIQLFCICFVDYSLYSMLTLMSYYGHMIEDVKPLAYKKIVITGGGHPKYLRYVWILLLYLLAWFMVFWEPYGLRRRHRTMMYFYPEESRRRVYDLHRTILHERKHLFKAKCREARFLNAFKNTHQFESYFTWLNSRLNWCLSCCTVSFIGTCCTICNKPLNKSDNVSCGWPNCRGIYCTTCFQDSHNKCVLCSSEYEDELLEHGNSSGNSDSDFCSVDKSYPQQRDKKI
ncbi:DC-STAMP domain-containing protein 2 isoform X2 [Drosophila teissieri]|uniref:DC-STAMP domain-containing protein 2 isoform X2 n=1 Tax=Drosophila teissieri TaxID=7243 RepID=UPI001CB9E2A5|nr:DC-STAMP domain-containing protein 2 isoform X2 [Drosophila teissieri]